MITRRPTGFGKFYSPPARWINPERMATVLMSDARRLVDKLWSYCNVLRDDGVGTIEYTEQLTYLLFLKMAHERETRSLNPEQIVPPNCSWQ